MSNIPEAVIWGAGKIGRGFLAEIFKDAGYHLNFIEYDHNLVDKLKDVESYNIYKVMDKNRQEKVEISDYSIYHTQDNEEIGNLVARDHTIIAIAVHQSALPNIAGMLGPFLDQKIENNPESRLDIIFCVNMSHPAAYFKNLLLKNPSKQLYSYLENNIGLIDSVVMRISPQLPRELSEKEPFAVINNGYPEMPVANCFRGPVPHTNMLRLTDQIEAEEKRKIYTLNMAHVILAFMGVSEGYSYGFEAIKNQEIKKAVSGALKEAAAGLSMKYGFSREEMNKWNRDIIKSLENPVLKDQLSRLASDSPRKLGRDDRLVGPALLAIEAGIVPNNLAKGIASGFKYVGDDQGSKGLQQYMKEKGIKSTIHKYCQLESGQLLDLILSIYSKISKGGK
jgi:mannitol-1-phosphate 5-dehydrogenase